MQKLTRSEGERFPRLVNVGVLERSPSLAVFEVAQFSREATAADSCGRQPADLRRSIPSRVATTAIRHGCRRYAALWTSSARFRGLSPTAICFRRIRG